MGVVSAAPQFTTPFGLAASGTCPPTGELQPCYHVRERRSLRCVNGYMKITHVWSEGDETKTHVHVARQPRETYTIDCGQAARVQSFSVELAE